MPITTHLPLRAISQEEFALIDYQVMRHAFACQNELGRLCDEIIYQNDLAARLDGAGLVRTQVPVTVTHGSFRKDYFLDLVLGDSAVYELKIATQLAAEHEAQVLNYLFLEGVQHGKLINFRPTKVQSRFVNTSLTRKSRQEIMLDTGRWQEHDGLSKKLRLVFSELIEDWGGFLELALYTEALTHFFGGEDQVVRAVPLVRNGLPLGNQRLRLLSPEIAFRITAMSETEAADYEHQLRSLLAHSALRTLQWLNLVRHHARLVTLQK